MWISNKEWSRLLERVSGIENRLSSLDAYTKANINFTVYHPTKTEWVPYYIGEIRTRMNISVQSVIRQILEKLGMELAYIEGKPDAVELQKAKKAA